MKNLLLNLSLKFFGKDIFTEYFKLKNLEFNSLEENLKLQRDKLKSILLYSWKNVPYYNKVLEEADVVIGGKVYLENFNKIPILTKKIIKNNFDVLKSKDPDYFKRKPYLNTSGGSTGEPVKFIQDKTVWTKSMAAAWLENSFVGDFPVRHIKLWGSERDIIKGGVGIIAIFKNWIYNRKFLNSFKMSEKDMFNFVKMINNYRPYFIETYIQSIFELSKFIRGNNLKIFSPNGIIVSAGTLYPDMKRLIEEVFNCKVLNRYGSREAGCMACSCEKGDQLHLNIFSHYFELLNDKLELCLSGELGKVYITTFDNFSMPLIRYDMGDIAVPADNIQCECGRGLPLIESVRGRDVNLFKLEDGSLIDGEYFTHLFYMKDWVEKFQVKQKNYNLIEINIIGKENSWEMESIENNIKKIMGNSCQIKWNFVTELLPIKSGKYMYTINEMV